MNNPVDRDCQGLTAAWDFSVGISTDQITDVSGNNLHGKLINLPTRGVCGHAWNGDKHCWTDLPEHYGAIHFHDDDLYDCEWETDFEIQLPDDMASGVYASSVCIARTTNTVIVICSVVRLAEKRLHPSRFSCQ